MDHTAGNSGLGPWGSCALGALTAVFQSQLTASAGFLDCAEFCSQPDPQIRPEWKQEPGQGTGTCGQHFPLSRLLSRAHLGLLFGLQGWKGLWRSQARSQVTCWMSLCYADLLAPKEQSLLTLLPLPSPLKSPWATWLCSILGEYTPFNKILRRATQVSQAGPEDREQDPLLGLCLLHLPRPCTVPVFHLHLANYPQKVDCVFTVP